MKPSYLLTAEPTGTGTGLLQTDASALRTAVQLTADGTPSKEHIRHILLGSPSAIQQTIHLLHTLHYAETILWTPVLTIEEPLTISPAQSEAISLLRKPCN